MHHLYPLAKGDPLCPLGFHPQVRWPTRCKRCFRDYKEHGGKRKDDDSSLRREDKTASTPSLSLNSKDINNERRRSWVSSSNLAQDNISARNESTSKNPSSWTSTPDLANLEDDIQAVTTYSITLPKRKPKIIDTGQRTVSDSVSSISKLDKSTVFNKNDSLATRVKKLQAIKESTEERVKRIQVKEVKTISEEPTNHDVQFLIQVKRKPSKEEEYQEFIETDDDTVSVAGTETTDTTLVDAQDHEFRDQLESLRKELETTKTKCERLEREKSDILLRRLAAMETTTSKTTATEVLKLQQKCNELQQSIEDYRDEKRSLSLKVKELEEDLEKRPTTQSAQKIADELRSKLLAAETLCEELMDENEDIKKELRDVEEQMDEMQDNFREDQAVEYTSLKKELDQTTKNCRILSFKLRKAERKSEQLEIEKSEYDKKLKEISGAHTTLGNLEKIKQLEQELKVSNEVSIRLQKELDESNQKLSKIEETSFKKTSALSYIGKTSGDGKMSRESLTRGGSQDDPAQLLRDLQDSIEREADLREQLKFAEEEAQNLRKKVSRIEDDNESLVLQLKKMANRARSRKLSPTNNARLSTQSSSEKSDVSDDEDPTEIKLQLELSEQEASVLRKKVEDLEADNHRIKNKNKELQDKLLSKTSLKKTSITNENGNSIQSQKVKILEDEANDLRKKLIEKERDCERLHAELSVNQKRTKTIQKSKSLDLDQQTLDLKRQLQVFEQEAAILRTKVQDLETENEKLIIENKKVQLLKGTKSLKSERNIDKYVDQIAILEVEIVEKNNKIKLLEEKMAKLNKSGAIKYKQFVNRTPKKISNLTTKDQLKIMVNDLESEIGEMIVAIKTSENEIIKLEEALKNSNFDGKNTKSASEATNKSDQTNKELSELKTKSENLSKSLLKMKETVSDTNKENKRLKDELEKAKNEKKTQERDNETLNEQINQLKSTIKTATQKQDEIANYIQKNNELINNVASKDNEINLLKKEIHQKEKSLNELQEKTDKIKSLEKKINEVQEKLKKSEKQNRDKIKELETTIEQEKNSKRIIESDQVTHVNKLNSEIEDLNNKISTFETTVESKKKLIEHLENKLKEENANKTTSKIDEFEINKIKEELRQYKLNLANAESKHEISLKNQKSLEEKLKIFEADAKASASLEKKIVDLEKQLQNERKKFETVKSNNEKEKGNTELELSSLRRKLKSLENGSVTGTKKGVEQKVLQEKIDKLEATLTKETQRYDDLTAKYEILEEEHVVTKATLVAEKEALQNQISSTKCDLDNLKVELQTLRDTYNNKSDVWIKEKLLMQEQISSIEKTGRNGNELELSLKASLQDKQSALDQLKKENENMNDQLEYMRKESDELRKKLDDYQKVNKVQRNISADSSAMEKEIRQLQAKYMFF